MPLKIFRTFWAFFWRFGRIDVEATLRSFTDQWSVITLGHHWYLKSQLLGFLKYMGMRGNRYSGLSMKLWLKLARGHTLSSDPEGTAVRQASTFSLSLSRPQLKRKAGQISRIFAEKYRVKSWSFWQIERLLRIVNLSETLFWKAAAETAAAAAKLNSAWGRSCFTFCLLWNCSFNLIQLYHGWKLKYPIYIHGLGSDIKIRSWLLYCCCTFCLLFNCSTW